MTTSVLSGEQLAEQLLDDLGMIVAAATLAQNHVEGILASDVPAGENTRSERLAIVDDELTKLGTLNRSAEVFASMVTRATHAAPEICNTAAGMVGQAIASFETINAQALDERKVSLPELALAA